MGREPSGVLFRESHFLLISFSKSIIFSYLLLKYHGESLFSDIIWINYINDDKGIELIYEITTDVINETKEIDKIDQIERS